MNAMLNPDTAITSVGVDIPHNVVDVGTTDPAGPEIAGLLGQFGDLLTIASESVGGSASSDPIASAAWVRSRTLFYDPMLAGLAIYTEDHDANCTSGFMFRAGDGDGRFPQRYSGLITAGHCVGDVGEKWRQGEHALGQVVDKSWDTGGRSDVGSIMTSNFPSKIRDVSNLVMITSHTQSGDQACPQREPGPAAGRHMYGGGNERRQVWSPPDPVGSGPLRGQEKPHDEDDLQSAPGQLPLQSRRQRGPGLSRVNRDRNRGGHVRTGVLLHTHSVTRYTISTISRSRRTEIGRHCSSSSRRS
jgi:hypothetical protein